jgi:predicted Zn-dependent protease
MPRCAVSPDQYSEHRAGGTLIDIPHVIDRVLGLSHADACIVIARRHTCANIRWANNTVTTNGATENVALSILSVVARRVGSVTRTYFPPEHLEQMVRESEAACEGKPEAPDYMPLPSGDAAHGDWSRPPVTTDIRVFDAFIPKLAAVFERARQSGVQTFGYAEHGAATVWLATSTGLRRRHADRIGKVDVTAKTPDFSRSSWAGAATTDFTDVDPGELVETLQRRLAWSKRQIDMPAGYYEVLLEPSCTSDLALGSYLFMARRDADEGRSPYSNGSGATRIGERLFGSVTLYSDPHEPGIAATPFHVGVASDGATSVFDNGVPTARTEWVRDGVLRALITPRYWAEKVGAPSAVPFVNNLIVAGDGPTMSDMIARTKRALLVTCLWYIRTVDPQTALQTGLTRDGVFLVEAGEVKGAVNNFRWNMSPIAALAQATEIGRTGMAMPREHDEFLRAKAPALRVERFNMSSLSPST